MTADPGESRSSRQQAEERTRQVQELKAQGLTQAEIGRRLGLSKSRVHQILRGKKPVRVRCRSCQADLNPAGALPGDDREVLCLDCLARTPGASFGDYLRALRLAAGMSRVTLGTRAAVAVATVAAYESGRGAPGWPVIARLFGALGVSLTITPAGAQEARTLRLG